MVPLLAGVVSSLVPSPGAAQTDDAVVPTFREVKSILKSQCFKCHSPEEKRAGLDLTTYGALLRGSTSGPVVVKGNPDESLLYLVVTHQEEPRMPPGSPKMPEDRLEAIREWIAAGLPETPSDVVSSPAPKSLAEKPETAYSGPKPSPTTTSSDAPHAHRSTPLTALASTPDGKLVAVSDQQRIVLLQVGSQELTPVAALPFPEGEIFTLRFSRDGRFLVAGGGKHAESGVAVLFEVATGQRLGVFGDEIDVVLAADLSPDGRWLALGGPQRLVKIYDTANGRLRQTLKRHTDWVLSISFSPEGLLMASSDRAGNTFVWEAESGAEVHSLRGHGSAVPTLHWWLRDDSLYTAGEDGQVILWDIHQGASIRSWAAHASGVLGLAVTTEGLVATSGRDGRVQVWKTGGEPLAAPIGPLDELPLQLVSVSEGRWLVGDWSGRVTLRGNDGRELAQVEPIRLAAETRSSGPPRIVSFEPETAEAGANSSAVAVRPVPATNGETSLTLSPSLPSRLSEEAQAAEQVLSQLLSRVRDQRLRLREAEAAAQAAEAEWQAAQARPRGSQTLNDTERVGRLAELLLQAVQDAEALNTSDSASALPSGSRDLQEVIVLTRLAAERAQRLATSPLDAVSQAEANVRAAQLRLDKARQNLEATLSRFKEANFVISGEESKADPEQSPRATNLLERETITSGEQ
jgi:WD40 repeat protein